MQVLLLLVLMTIFSTASGFSFGTKFPTFNFPVIPTFDFTAFKAINGRFSPWSACTATCGGGTQGRNCNSPPPLFGGLNCIGETIQTCGTSVCPENQAQEQYVHGQQDVLSDWYNSPPCSEGQQGGSPKCVCGEGNASQLCTKKEKCIEGTCQDMTK